MQPRDLACSQTFVQVLAAVVSSVEKFHHLTDRINVKSLYVDYPIHRFLYLISVHVSRCGTG